MFTIKALRKDGYTAFCGEIYSLTHNADGSVTFQIIPKASNQAEGYPVTIGPSEGYANIVYVENAAGKTIDTIRFPYLANEE